MASNPGMTHPTSHPADLQAHALADRRLTDLEVKASYAEDLLDTLNRIVAEQQRQIDRLTRELAQLQLQQQSADGGGGARSLRDELPPHW